MYQVQKTVNGEINLWNKWTIPSSTIDRLKISNNGLVMRITDTMSVEATRFCDASSKYVDV